MGSVSRFGSMSLPLPQIDHRLQAFIGRFDPNEVITESSEPSGASRMDMERIYELRWLARLTGSVSIFQRSQGVLWWSAADLMRGFASRRALALELESDGQTDAPAPLHNYGAKFAYRQSVVRRWLIMELRTSVSWPKDLPQQDRRLSPGLGLGFEMLIGTDEFLARPVTF